MPEQEVSSPYHAKAARSVLVNPSAPERALILPVAKVPSSIAFRLSLRTAAPRVTVNLRSRHRQRL